MNNRTQVLEEQRRLWTHAVALDYQRLPDDSVAREAHIEAVADAYSASDAHLEMMREVANKAGEDSPECELLRAAYKVCDIIQPPMPPSEAGLLRMKRLGDALRAKKTKFTLAIEAVFDLQSYASILHAKVEIAMQAVHDAGFVARDTTPFPQYANGDRALHKLHYEVQSGVERFVDDLNGVEDLMQEQSQIHPQVAPRGEEETDSVFITDGVTGSYPTEGACMAAVFRQNRDALPDELCKMLGEIQKVSKADAIKEQAAGS